MSQCSISVKDLFKEERGENTQGTVAKSDEDAATLLGLSASLVCTPSSL